jgi:hypothetical protein
LRTAPSKSDLSAIATLSSQHAGTCPRHRERIIDHG